jgi:hypothetical protein
MITGRSGSTVPDQRPDCGSTPEGSRRPASGPQRRASPARHAGPAAPTTPSTRRTVRHLRVGGVCDWSRRSEAEANMLPVAETFPTSRDESVASTSGLRAGSWATREGNCVSQQAECPTFTMGDFNIVCGAGGVFRAARCWIAGRSPAGGWGACLWGDSGGAVVRWVAVWWSSSQVSCRAVSFRGA